MVGGRAVFVGISLLGLALSVTPSAANPFLIEPEAPAFTTTFAMRYWYGMGDSRKYLYGLTRDTLNSRLVYDGLQSHSLEGYFRVDHQPTGLFWKGYGGGGLLTQGTLKDEDFPPVISPYSNTTSTLQNQTIGYVSFDFGGALLRGPDFRFDGFVGYHYFHQRIKAFGCTQTASNPFICAGGIPDSVAAIVEDDTWQALRVGVSADIPIADRLRLNVEAAWLPYAWLNGTDNHLLRPDLPFPVREDGVGWGYQFEAVATYKVDDAISVGVGGRFWHMESRGNAHFEDLGGSAQPLDFKTNIFGVFLQGSYRFGPH